MILTSLIQPIPVVAAERENTFYGYLEKDDNLKFYFKIPEKYRDYAATQCYEAGQLPLWALYVMIDLESGWNPKARHANKAYDPAKDIWYVWSVDRGIGQICSAYQAAFVHDFYKGDPKKFNVWNWQDNLQVSIYHLADLRKTFNGNWYKAFAAYNGGKIMVITKKIIPNVDLYATILLKRGGHPEYIPVKPVPVKKSKKILDKKTCMWYIIGEGR